MSLRSTMPHTAAFIDALRAEFGVAEINAQIRKGMKGGTEFYARENGQEIGRRDLREGVIPAVFKPVTIGRLKHGR